MEGWREEGGRDRARGGREEAMMLGSQRASVEEGRVEGRRVDKGNERGRDGTRHGRREGGSEQGEELSEERREQGSKVGKLQGRYPKEGTPGQYTVYSHPIPQRGPCH